MDGSTIRIIDWDTHFFINLMSSIVSFSFRRCCWLLPSCCCQCRRCFCFLLLNQISTMYTEGFARSLTAKTCIHTALAHTQLFRCVVKFSECSDNLIRNVFAFVWTMQMGDGNGCLRVRASKLSSLHFICLLRQSWPVYNNRLCDTLQNNWPFSYLSIRCKGNCVSRSSSYIVSFAASQHVIFCRTNVKSITGIHIQH